MLFLASMVGLVLWAGAAVALLIPRRDTADEDSGYVVNGEVYRSPAAWLVIEVEDYLKDQSRAD